MLNHPFRSGQIPFLTVLSSCTGDGRCKGDTWVYDIEAAAWSYVNVLEDNLPITRYRQSLVDYNKKLYVFGGESYKPYMVCTTCSGLCCTCVC